MQLLKKEIEALSGIELSRKVSDHWLLRNTWLLWQLDIIADIVKSYDKWQWENGGSGLQSPMSLDNNHNGCEEQVRSKGDHCWQCQKTCQWYKVGTHIDPEVGLDCGIADACFGGCNAMQLEYGKDGKLMPQYVRLAFWNDTVHLWLLKSRESPYDKFNNEREKYLADIKPIRKYLEAQNEWLRHFVQEMPLPKTTDD